MRDRIPHTNKRSHLLFTSPILKRHSQKGEGGFVCDRTPPTNISDRTHSSPHPFLTRHSEIGEEDFMRDRIPHTNKRDLTCSSPHQEPYTTQRDR